MKCLRENVLTNLLKESLFIFRDDERVQRVCESGANHARGDGADSRPIQYHEDKLQTTAVEYSSFMPQSRLFSRKVPNSL